MQDGESLYQPVRPTLDLGLPYMPTRVDVDYFSWPFYPTFSLYSSQGCRLNATQQGDSG
jgi:hypothetical protein